MEQREGLLPRLLVRADAGVGIGVGHAMRCLALAHAWKSRGGEVEFLSHGQQKSLEERVERAGMKWTALARVHPHPGDLETTIRRLGELAESSAAPWLVLDGYHFDSTYHQSVRGAGYPLLVIDDDSFARAHHGNILLNPILDGANAQTKSLDFLILSGLEFVLLRSEFLVHRGRKRSIAPIARRVLVTFGGSDPRNVTLKAMKAVKTLPIEGLEVIVVAGGHNQHTGLLQQEMSTWRHPVRLVKDTVDMPGLMAWADVALSAAGSTCWELAFMGLPSMVIVTAENQERVASVVEKSGFGISLGQELELTEADIRDAVYRLCSDKSMRRQLSHRGREVVDGAGGERVAEVIVQQHARISKCRPEVGSPARRAAW